ncbi:Flp pilus assembly complex ATPase component TadA [Candidatus Woesearchaeota archaeon]|nr:Flp pilus assembly complex ATPase component TadA [Candidatus Woesearchaeota archaeon]
MPLAPKNDWDFEVIREGEENILFIYVESFPMAPSLEDSELVMGKTVDILEQISDVTKIVFTQNRDYEYDLSQTSMIKEIADLHKKILQDKTTIGYISFSTLNINNRRFVGGKYTELQNILYKNLKADPIGAYVELTRIGRRERIEVDKFVDENIREVIKKYIAVIHYILSLLDKTRVIELAKPYLPGYKVGDRTVYRYIFAPTIKPDFMFTKLMANYPNDGEEIDSYSLDEDTEVTIFKFHNSIKILYHVMPPEFKLSEDKYELLDTARKMMVEHKPKQEEFTNPERMRQVFANIGHDLIQELANNKGVTLRPKDIDKITEILVRYTVGFGLIEVLLKDENIQDIVINSPMGKTPMFVVHAKYGECYTNIIPTKNEAESWASKLRLISGRPLDEANPIIDTELELPGAFTRVSVIAPPLDPTGLAFAFRRHRDKPWTLPLFIKYKMINPLAAGLLSFFVDGTRATLVAGTRSAGKSSLLSSLMVEIMRKYRVITIEDSVTGDTEIVVRIKGQWKRTTVGKLINEEIEKYGYLTTHAGHEITSNFDGIEIMTMDKKGKIKIAQPATFIRHKVKKPIYRVTTKTGRTIKVTEDHGLFILGKEAAIEEAKITDLKIGSKIAVPRMLPLINHRIDTLNLFNKIIEREYSFITGAEVNNLLEKYYNQIVNSGQARGYSYWTIKGWKRRKILPGEIIKDLMAIAPELEFSNCSFKCGENSIKKMPSNLLLTNDFLTFLGLWIADGCYDKSSVIISCNDQEDREIFDKIAKQFGFERKIHSDSISYMINSKTLKIVLQDMLGFTGNAYTKRIPEWIFNLGPDQIAAFLKGIFSGDGCATDKEIVIPLASEQLLKDLQTLLLLFKIILRVGTKRKGDKTLRANISDLVSLQNFAKYIGFLQEYKSNILFDLCQKVSTHDVTDTFDFLSETKKQLSELFGSNFNTNDYIKRNNTLGRKKLSSLLETKQGQQVQIIEKLHALVQADIFFDRIIYIELVTNNETQVYDFSVPDNESFICNNIVAHNTLELPTKNLRDLGFNIQSMKVASALAAESTEVSADKGIRATLRLGDSALIIGEVRSKEAIALYEAMRVGAAANVVAGTIHGDSPYGVFDRVVNDIGIPKTSFKATDIIITTNPVKSADGLSKKRRVTQITEVRKHWQNDPLTENGFVDLMKYNAEKDELLISDELKNGDSESIKAIAGNIKEFAGNWDAVWDNIVLRAKTKEALVAIADQINDPNILEAGFYIKANDQFHLICQKIQEEAGSLDSKRILFEWTEWLKREVKKKKYAELNEEYG